VACAREGSQERSIKEEEEKRRDAFKKKAPSLSRRERRADSKVEHHPQRVRGEVTEVTDFPEEEGEKL